MNMLRKTLTTVAAGLLITAFAHASEGAQMTGQVAPIDRHDVASLQRGAKMFVNYCMGCHGAQYMRYNRLQSDLGLSERQISENLIFRGTLAKDGYVTDKIGETMKTAMDPADAKAIFGVAPPDLSVEARVRGTDWLYAYLRGYYRDEKSATGWNNLAFPGVAMPHALWELGGQNKLVVKEFDNHEVAKGALLQTHVVGTLEAIHTRAGGKETVKYLLKYIEPDKPGKLSVHDYDVAVADLVNYLDYMAEPVRNERIQLGIKVLIFLAILFVFAYWTKREYWKDVH
jgi:ubiquinol-cytochrome c reductase cytochrome c1 subunit